MYFLALAIVVVAASGCDTIQTYDLSVRNNTPEPVTLWLTKDGPPVEPGWRSPEELARDTLGSDEQISGIIVAPGKTAESGLVKGHFKKGTTAWLRVYAGERKFSEILATSHGSPNRIDFPLAPGKSDLVVTDQNGHLAVVHGN
jgi:hypothetical protein